ncbi:hypothetical protein EM868_19200 [Cupriavidus gilardii]|uniref:hypothetical protein n=1 Tax=Cupriavidus gilardii TaxID=82541 RepID=UPI001571C5D3|nr:hypothetical protein [Cupriavidus gilardii]MCG5259637.1 hypothetical protein [Cupriavidus gilardii]MDF9431905.1 hypothetical protein [Cupriavidus gilardii]NSX03418.1 hypothetical protein [Cupriavidus gilardii]
MQPFAALLGLAGAACLYLAGPNQVLLRRPPQRRMMVWLGIVLTSAGAVGWSVEHSWPSAIAATLATLGTGLSLWPFLGCYLHKRRGGEEAA